MIHFKELEFLKKNEIIQLNKIKKTLSTFFVLHKLHMD